MRVGLAAEPPHIVGRPQDRRHAVVNPCDQLAKRILPELSLKARLSRPTLGMRDWPSPVTDVASDRGPARRAEKAKTEKEAEDGLETTFALNHMAYFVATRGLRDVASAPARVVSTASAAHQGATVDFDDLQLAKTFGPMKA
jgi:hypothetical protein